MSDDPEYDVDFRAHRCAFGATSRSRGFAARRHPEKYDIGRGEEGVFKVEPYKSELLDPWGYADRERADEAGEAICGKYREYRANDDFPGMDMARKYLQMGYTRAMRYARYPGGQKYVDGNEREPTFRADHDKREAALVYEVWWQRVENDEDYQRAKELHRRRGDG